MGRRNKKNKRIARNEANTNRGERSRIDLHPQTKRAIWAVLLITLSCLVILSFAGKGGFAGAVINKGLFSLLGRVAFFVPLILLASSGVFFMSLRRNVYLTTLLGGAIFLVSVLGLFATFGNSDARYGGILGEAVTYPTQHLFGSWGTVLVFGALFFISVLVFLNMPLGRTVKREDSEKLTPEAKGEKGERMQFNSLFKKMTDSGSSFRVRSLPSDGSREEGNSGALVSSLRKPREASQDTKYQFRSSVSYKNPPLDLLEGDSGKPSSGDIKASSNIIKRTLQNFGIEVEMGEVSIGPTVTQYTLKPAEGVKLARITVLSNDLSLALAAHPLRIEAPIPGKSLVGIEIPNKQVQFVRLRSLLSHEGFQSTKGSLTFALGRDVAGNPLFADLDRMPHLLIAGATGSGKTIALNSVLMSLLYRNSPKLMRLILIDPKRVEFPIYNGVPHLLTPVITDVQKTINALRWAVGEMDRRFNILAEFKARDINSYNLEVSKKGEGEGHEFMPYIVVIVDELADLMLSRPREVEGVIVRLAQMARAVGIHLILATQRPSVEVITGLIKANITSRFAFQVASQIDSRTILDTSGAEKLLGNGDMLYLSAETSKPRRIQGAYISDAEVKRVVDYITKSKEANEEADAMVDFSSAPPGESQFIDLDSVETFDGNYDGDDPLLEEAKKEVVRAKKASASFLQRRLRIGYARAARLLDLLEEQGVIGPGDGAKPREVYIGEDEV